VRLFNERGRNCFALSFLGNGNIKKGGNDFGFSGLCLSYINENSILRYRLHMHSILFEWRPVKKKNLNTIIHLEPLEFVETWEASSE
jgi:hypothetical protein